MIGLRKSVNTTGEIEKEKVFFVGKLIFIVTIFFFVPTYDNIFTITNPSHISFLNVIKSLYSLYVF